MRAWLGALLAVAGLTLGGVVDASAASRGTALSTFELHGSNGYSIGGAFGGSGNAQRGQIEVTKDKAHAIYDVPLQRGPSGRGKASFGALGSFDLRFEKRKRQVKRFENGCVFITEKGVFRGRFAFSGEAGYTAAEASAIPGEVLRLPRGFCMPDDPRRARPPARGPLPPFLDLTEIAARAPLANGVVSFTGSSFNFIDELSFGATIEEQVGTMAISRSNSARAGSDLHMLVDGKPARTLDVAPPSPFSGSAHFERTASGAATWIGDLAVPLPGAGTVALAGPGFGARICRRVSLLGECRVTPPPGDGGVALR